MQAIAKTTWTGGRETVARFSGGKARLRSRIAEHIDGLERAVGADGSVPVSVSVSILGHCGNALLTRVTTFGRDVQPGSALASPNRSGASRNARCAFVFDGSAVMAAFNGYVFTSYLATIGNATVSTRGDLLYVYVDADSADRARAYFLSHKVSFIHATDER